MRNTVLAVFLIIISLSVMSVFVIGSDATPSDESESDIILFDMGNGKTTWESPAYSDGDTVDKMLSKTAEAAGLSYEFSAGSISIDGKTEEVIGTGSGSGSFEISGTTSTVVVSSWHLYSWDETVKQWSDEDMSVLSDPYSGGEYAIGFHPDGIVPVETPQYATSWTMVRGDAENSGNQASAFSATEPAEVKWTDTRGGQSGVYSSVLYVQDYVIAKFGTSSGMGSELVDAALKCYTVSGEECWSFYFPGILYYETATPLIVGDYVYVTSGLGYIFKLPWKIGPGDNNENVTMFDGAVYDRDKVSDKIGAIPYDTHAQLTGSTYSTGCGSLVYDSGAIYCKASNGMMYCFDTDLNLIWSHQMFGHTYFIAPTVVDGYVFAGALDGNLYVMDKTNGNLIDSEKVYTKESRGNEYGSVNGICVVKTGETYSLMFGVTDGRGMSSTVGGIAIYSFDGEHLKQIFLNTEVFGMTSNYPVVSSDDEFTGIYFATSKGLYRIDTTGGWKLLTNSLAEIHAGPVLVNGEHLYLASFTAGKPNYIVNIDGSIEALISPPSNIRNYNMSAMTVIGDWVFVGNDSGMYAIYGVFPEYVEPVSDERSLLETVSVIVVVILAILIAIYVVLRLAFKKEKPFSFIANSVMHFIRGAEYSHNTKNRHRLWVVLIVGFVVMAIVFIVCLAVGSASTLSLSETFSALASAISKGGQNLVDDEITVYSSRLPRTMAALAVGVGLSIAGSIYQAIIRNPLVDPYIMGVSAGAGTAAIAVIAFDFTFFGLFSPHSIYLVAFTAMVGGLIAFFATMLIAEKAGGSSINYVLAGVVVGLGFSAVQTLMMSLAGHQVTNVLSWLFGSFSNIAWNQVGMIVIPAIALSLVPLFWAKEFNLVLLGEDQAKQMGLNVRMFNRCMLILASVLTSICVAFVGIIGFVGLVIPHLCRMILGGDHRLVLPSSIVLGGILMMLADFSARMLFFGQELPVGAITTIIGVPVFAYLLIRKGRMYDG